MMKLERELQSEVASRMGQFSLNVEPLNPHCRPFSWLSLLALYWLSIAPLTESSILTVDPLNPRCRPPQSSLKTPSILNVGPTQLALYWLSIGSLL
jgi:hypothetical protein